MPPISSSVVDDMVDVLRTVLAERSGVYVSAPITSGRRFFALQAKLQAGGAGPVEIDAATLAREVVEPNVAETVALVRAARERFGYTVIDPSPLVVPGWAQDTYIALWGAVVRRHARLVVFSEGWELSSGCTYEFVVACEEGIPAADARLQPLSREQGIEIIANAKAELEARGVVVRYLDERLERLRQPHSHAAGAAGGRLDSGNRSTLCALMLGTVAPPRTATVVCSPPGGDEAELVMELRARGKLVVETAAFAPPAWSSAELRDFRRRAIEAYAADVVLGRGWESDEECVAAFIAAAQAGIGVTGTNGEPISLEAALASVEPAVAALDARGAAPPGLRDLVTTLKELHHVQ